MTEQQFDILRQDLEIYKNEIITKLEEIRCGIIDVETINGKILSDLQGYG